MKSLKEMEMILVRKGYTEAVRPVKATPKDWEGFVRRWETALEEATDIRAPEAFYIV